MAKRIMTLDEFEVEFKIGIGVEIELDEFFNKDATRDNIKSFPEKV